MALANIAQKIQIYMHGKRAIFDPWSFGTIQECWTYHVIVRPAKLKIESRPASGDFFISESTASLSHIYPIRRLTHSND